MAMTTTEKTVLVIGGLAVGGLFLYLLDAATDQDPSRAPVPKAIKDKLSVVVDTLDRAVGKQWGRRSLRELRGLLVSVLPGWEVALVDFVYQAERHGTEGRWDGPQKLAYAASLAAA